MEDNEGLCVLSSTEYIRSVVFLLGAQKALEPDGMSGIFYQHYWDTVGRALIQIVQHFFRAALPIHHLLFADDLLLAESMLRRLIVFSLFLINMLGFLVKK